MLCQMHEKNEIKIIRISTSKQTSDTPTKREAARNQLTVT